MTQSIISKLTDDAIDPDWQALVALLRALYGSGSDSGFTGVIASTQNSAPIASIEEGFYCSRSTG